MKAILSVANGLAFIGSIFYGAYAHDWHFLAGFLVSGVIYVVTKHT